MGPSTHRLFWVVTVIIGTCIGILCILLSQRIIGLVIIGAASVFGLLHVLSVSLQRRNDWSQSRSAGRLSDEQIDNRMRLNTENRQVK
jgi:FtsH-binding integral membrane protein